MVASRRVSFHNLAKVLARKPIDDTNQGRPQSAMHQRDLPIDEPAYENGLELPNSAGDREHLMTLSMTPPASTSGFAHNGFDQ